MPFTNAPTRTRSTLPSDLPAASVAQAQGHPAGAAYLSDEDHKTYRLVHASWRLDPKSAPPKPNSSVQAAAPAPAAPAPVAAVTNRK